MGDATLIPSGAPASIWSASSSRRAVHPGTGPQHLDEIVLGGELEVVPGARAAIHYMQRRMGMIIEDMQSNMFDNFVIGNPPASRRTSPTLMPSAITMPSR